MNAMNRISKKKTLQHVYYQTNFYFIWERHFPFERRLFNKWKIGVSVLKASRRLLISGDWIKNLRIWDPKCFKDIKNTKNIWKFDCKLEKKNQSFLQRLVWNLCKRGIKLWWKQFLSCFSIESVKKLRKIISQREKTELSGKPI